MGINAAIRCFAVGLVVAFGLLAEARAAEPRVALVIGNGAYRSVPELDNSRNDADDISEQLKRVGFAVIDGRDLDRSAMYAALGRFAQRVRGTDAGLVYYSGHGMQINGQNYLVPVDLKLRERIYAVRSGQARRRRRSAQLYRGCQAPGAGRLPGQSFREQPGGK